MVAKRHMELYGTTSEQFGAVAIAQRKWANMNPLAHFRDKPLTMDDYFGVALDLASRFVCSTAAWCPTAVFA